MKFIKKLNQYKYHALYRIINLSNQERLIITLYQSTDDQCEWSIVNNLYIFPLYKHYSDKIFIYYHIIDNFYFLFTIWDYYMNVNLMRAIQNNQLLKYYQSLNIDLVQLNDTNEKINYICYDKLMSWKFLDIDINTNIIDIHMLNNCFNKFKTELLSLL